MRFRMYLLAGLIAIAGLAGGAGCGGCSGGSQFPPDAGIDSVVRGSIALSWTVVDPGGKSLSCDQLDPNGSVVMHLQGTSSTTAGFRCRSCSGTSDPLAPGPYTASPIDLSGELPGLEWGPVHGDPAGQAITVTAGAPVPATTRFVVDTSGQLTLRFAFPELQAPYCSNGMVGTFQISLVRLGVGCEKLTFTRSGGTNTTPYKVDCSSPPAASCIDSGETLSSNSVPAGRYQITVRVKKQTVDFWGNDDQFQVVPRIPADRVVPERVLNLLSFPSGFPDAGVPPAPVDAGPGC